MPADSFQLIYALAVILVAALVGGRFAALCRIPASPVTC